MPRDIDPGTYAAMTTKPCRPVFMVDIAEQGGSVAHACSLPCSLAWNGATYTGVGDLGELQFATEVADVMAAGATISLSGVLPADIQLALSTVQVGGAATIWMGFLNAAGGLAGAPICVYHGIIDPPVIGTPAQVDANGRSTAKISIPIESRLAVMGSGQQRKLTRTDQALTHPDDSGLDWVEEMNNMALLWSN